MVLPASLITSPDHHPVSPQGRTSPFRRIRDTDVASSTFPTPAPSVGDGLDGMIAIRGNIGAEFMFIGTGDENDQIDYQLWLVRHWMNTYTKSHASRFPVFEPIMYCSGTATLSTLTGADDSDEPGYVGVDYRFADTVTKTLTDFGTYVETAMARASVEYSPGSNAGRASLCIPDMMSHAGFLMLVKPGDSTPADSANALVRVFA